MPLIPSSLVLAFALAGAVAPPAARVSHVEGAVSIDGTALATRGGRAEVVLAGGALVHIDAATSIRWDRADTVLMHAGRLFVRTAGSRPVRVETPVATAILGSSGIYAVLVEAAPARMLVSVVAGDATLSGHSGTPIRAHARQVVMLDPVAPQPWVVDAHASAADSFSAWSNARVWTNSSLDGTAPPDIPSAPAVAPALVQSMAPPAAPCGAVTAFGFPAPCWTPPVYGGSFHRRGHGRRAPSYAPDYRPNFDVAPPRVRPSPPPPPPPPPVVTPPPPPGAVLRGTALFMPLPRRPESR